MRFIGCKTSLLPFLIDAVNRRVPGGTSSRSFCDLLAGTGSVGQSFKHAGWKVYTTDLLYFSYVMTSTHIGLDKYPSFAHLRAEVPDTNSSVEHPGKSEQYGAVAVIDYLNNLPGTVGFISSNYAPTGSSKNGQRRMYFTDENAGRIDAIRSKIAEWHNNGVLNDEEERFLVCSLVEAVPFVSNISGTYAAFLKGWDPRAFKKLKLSLPEVVEGPIAGKVSNVDALQFVRDMGHVDVLYLDPPYNARQYAPNYHILETIARWDNPSIKGVTGVRPYNDLKSDFCRRDGAVALLRQLVSAADWDHLFLSYNDEGIMSENDIRGALEGFGEVEIEERPYQRFRSHKSPDDAPKVSERLYYVHRVVQRAKRKPQENKLNDLSGAEWVHFLSSVEVTHFPTKGTESYAHNIRKQHPSPKPPQLMEGLIRFFTKSGQTVLDPFMGVGGTLLGASLAGRRAIGVELSQSYIDLYQEATTALNLQQQVTICGDSMSLLDLLKPKTMVDLVLTDPPYSEMLSKKHTGEEKKKSGVAVATPFTNASEDLGNMKRDQFLVSLRSVIEQSVSFLKPRGYVVVFAKDLQPQGKNANMLHAEVTETLLQIPSLSFRGYKIWYDATPRLYPFGYPYAFVANQLHQFILIFRKEEGQNAR
jgi:adenine-specific DNA methylase/DNA modification methylase